jgi:hypothetical protein
MSTIIMRSALVYWGRNPPPELHSVEIDWKGERHIVTWADVFRERREPMERSPYWKRHVKVWRPHRVWVAYFDQEFFGGWQAFIGDHRGRCGESWIDRDRDWLKPNLMRLFPLVLPFESDIKSRFYDWKEAFARAYRRGTHHGRPRGSAIVWWNGGPDAPRLTRPSRCPLLLSAPARTRPSSAATRPA